MDGIVQVAQGIGGLHKQSRPYILCHFSYLHKPVSSYQSLDRCSIQKRKRCRDEVTSVVLCVASTLPSIDLSCVVFGTAISKVYV